MSLGVVPDRPEEFPGNITITAIHSGQAKSASELVQAIRPRPNDLVDPWLPDREMEVLVDMGARGKGDTFNPRIALAGTDVLAYGALDFSPEMKRAQVLGPLVHPAHRRKGLGQAILTALLEQARTAGQKAVRAAVGTHNGAGRAFLEAAGFRAKEGHTCLRLPRPPRLPSVEMKGITLRPVEAEDGALYYDFTKRLVPRQPKQARALLKSDEYVAILAWRGQEPVGCVEIDMRAGDVASLEVLEGPPPLLQKGLGNLLLAEAIRVAFSADRTTCLDFLLAGAEAGRIEHMTKLGFQVRYELLGLEMKL